jgi:hypothetical protein
MPKIIGHTVNARTPIRVGSADSPLIIIETGLVSVGASYGVASAIYLATFSLRNL